MDEKIIDDMLALVDGAFDEHTCSGWNSMPEKKRKEWCRDFAAKHVRPIASDECGKEPIISLSPFDSEKIKDLLVKANKYNDQSNIINTVRGNILSDGGEATIYIRSKGLSMKVRFNEEDEELVDSILQMINNRYKRLVRETKQEIDRIYESFLGERCVEEKNINNL